MESNMRCGVNRKSQNTNVLLVHSELGRSKRVTFELPSSKDQTFVYGLEKPRDLEGARDVSMRWVEHQPNPDNKPGPDFIAMNKLAADEHVITSKDQIKFRKQNFKTLKTGKDKEGQLKKAISLPSQSDPSHTYGRSSSMRPYEETRLTGVATRIDAIVQGDFMNEWVRMNEKRASDFTAAHARIIPRATKATVGHATAAKAKIESTNANNAKDPFKMKKFNKVPAKVFG